MMRLKAADVQIGMGFVNTRLQLLRVIGFESEFLDPGVVFWRAYSLEDLAAGVRTYHDSFACSKERIVQWADREVTPEEMQQVQRLQSGSRG